MNDNTLKGNHTFEERIPDLLRIADRGRIAVGPFLTPGERVIAQRIINSLGCGDRALFFGGYASAERTRLYYLPDYMERGDVSDPTNPIFQALVADEDDGIQILRVQGSGYVKLTHRDYLGAILGLGIERDSVGDLIVEELTCSAILFCTSRISPFIESHLSQVGADTVSVSRVEYDPQFEPVRKVQSVSDTIASCRLDCVVAALASVSREEAQRLVRSALVELDYETETKPDKLLEPPHIISIRGHGKFKLISIGDVNRRGRLRLRAEKYI